MALNPNLKLDADFVYKNDGLHQIDNEPMVIDSDDVPIPLKHDFASNITIYTGLDQTGTQITDFTTTVDSTDTWEVRVHFGATTRGSMADDTVYVNYTTTGDMWDADAVQKIHNAVVDLETVVDGISSGQVTQVASTVPADDAVDIVRNSTVVTNFNKWIDENQTNKLKVYSDSGRTSEVSGTVTKSGNKQLTWTPSGNFDYSTMYYPRVSSGVLGVDGVSLISNYDWNFQIMAQPPNAAPAATNVTITGTTTIGSTLTGSYTYSDADSDSEGTSTFRWLRNDVAITGATSLTYQLVEADIGKTIKFEVTPVASAGTSPGTPVASSGTSIPVPVPTGVSASAGNNQATVFWTNNTSFTGETYTVKRSTTSNGTYSTVTGGSGQTGNSFIDTTAVNGTTYYYKVSMTLNSSESADSTATSGVTPAANNAPTLTSVSISGNTIVGETLTATANGYGDTEGDLAGTHLYQWYSATTSDGSYSAISGATNSTYILQSTDSNKYIKCGVRPVAQTGSSPGNEVLSSASTLVYSVIENFSGSDGSVPNASLFDVSKTAGATVALNGSGLLNISTTVDSDAGMVVRKANVNKESKTRKATGKITASNVGAITQMLSVVQKSTSPTYDTSTNINNISICQCRAIESSGSYKLDVVYWNDSGAIQRWSMTDATTGTWVSSGNTQLSISLNTNYVIILETTSTQWRYVIKDSADTTVLMTTAWVNWSGTRNLNNDSMWAIIGDPSNNGNYGTLLVDKYEEI